MPRNTGLTAGGQAGPVECVLWGTGLAAGGRAGPAGRELCSTGGVVEQGGGVNEDVDCGGLWGGKSWP